MMQEQCPLLSSMENQRQGKSQTISSTAQRVLQKPSGSVTVEADKAAKRFLTVAGSKLGSTAESNLSVCGSTEA